MGAKRTSGAGRARPAPVPRDDGVIEARRLGKAYTAVTTARPAVAALRRPSVHLGENVALADVDLSVPRGQALGVIGPNGAGKSTLLRLIAEITEPSTGTLRVGGSTRAVIELGTGFHPDLTGLENIRCLGVLHGRTLRDIDASIERIVEFAGIGHALDVPLKQYSLGMKARLAFAVVTDLRPDVLVVDEVLVVGDQEFQLRCFERIASMVDQGTTLVFVSHEMAMVASACERIVQLRHGRVVDDGEPSAVIERYVTRSASRITRAEHSPLEVLPGEVHPGDTGRDSVRLWVDVDVAEPVYHPSIGLDVVLPLVDPDNVVSSTTGPLPAFEEPGRYRITGTTDSIGGAGRNIRFNVSLLDAHRQRVLDAASVDADVVGDLSGLRVVPLGVAMSLPLTWEIAPVGPEEQEPVGRRRQRAPSGEPVIVLDGVTKHYRAPTHGATIRPALPGRWGRLRHRDVVALDDIRLGVAAGESVGLIGPNASGKSTLLRVAAGLTDPDAGSVATHGRILSLLDLGSSFHPDLSGAENLRVHGRLMGINPRQLDRYLEDAVECSGLREVIDHRLRTYSTGMVARLAMSMGLVVPAAAMLIDEVLSVGDEEFRRRAAERLVERVDDGLAVLFVSHDLQLVEQVCDRVVRLDHGRCVDDGPTDEVIAGYAGTAWAGGVHDGDGGIRLKRLVVDRHHLPTGGTLELDGVVVVDEPVPDALLELTLRSPLKDRLAELTTEERARMSAMVVTVVPPGRELTRPGAYRFHCRLDVEHLVGELDVVVSAVDPAHGRVLSEVWEQVQVGSPEPGAHLTVALDVDWSVQRLD